METTFDGRDTQHQQYHHHLGLGLGMAGTTSPVEAAAPPTLRRQLQQSWNGAGVFFPASSGEQGTHADDRRLAELACHEMPFLHGIDVNRVPATWDTWGRCAASEDEEPDASSRSSGGEQERAGARSDEEDDSKTRGGGSRKRLRLSRDQSALLEESLMELSTLNPKQQKVVLARQLGLRPRQVEVWFQNRRARRKHKQTEMVCEALKRCCETLTEENRRLKRELRALKLLAPPAPHLYMRASPPTTLPMCPSCERVAPSGKPAAAMDENRVSLGPVPVLPLFVGRPAQMS